MNRTVLRYSVALLLLIVVALYLFARPLWYPMVSKIVGKRSVAEVVERYGEQARARLHPHFVAAGVAYPPRGVALLALKEEARLELWAEGEEGMTWIHTYEIQALSGGAGPKLREGDRQVPEGFYRIIGLNPNSAYHLSMKLDYPNGFDREHAEAEGRSEPGTNIFIHGKAASIGCLAMGDVAIEELFVLTHDVGRANVNVAIAPRDPRRAPLSIDPIDLEPAWVAALYREINDHFAAYSRVVE